MPKVANPVRDTHKHIVNSIQHKLIDRGWTQTDLAKRLNVSKGTLSDNFTGRSEFRLDRLVLIANVLNCTLKDLV